MVFCILWIAASIAVHLCGDWMHSAYPGPPGHTYSRPPLQQRSASRRSRCCAGCAGLLFVSSLCFFGTVVATIIAPPRRSPAVQQRREEALRLWESPPPESPSPQAPTLELRVQEAVERLESTPADTGPVPFQVVLTEDEVNMALATDRQVRAALAAQGVRRVSILFEDGHAVIEGVVELGGVEVHVTAHAVPIVNPDGTIRVAIEHARAGVLPLPPTVLNKVRAKLEEILRQQDPRRGIIDSITVDDGVLSLRGRVTGELPSAEELRQWRR